MALNPEKDKWCSNLDFSATLTRFPSLLAFSRAFPTRFPDLRPLSVAYFDRSNESCSLLAASGRIGNFPIPGENQKREEKVPRIYRSYSRKIFPISLNQEHITVTGVTDAVTTFLSITNWNRVYAFSQEKKGIERLPEILLVYFIISDIFCSGLMRIFKRLA